MGSDTISASENGDDRVTFLCFVSPPAPDDVDADDADDTNKTVTNSQTILDRFETVPDLPENIARSVSAYHDLVDGKPSHSAPAKLIFDKSQYDATNDLNYGLRDGTRNSTEQRFKSLTGDALRDVYNTNNRLGSAERNTRDLASSMDGLVKHQEFMLQAAKENQQCRCILLGVWLINVIS